MKLRISMDGFRVGLLAALGVLPVSACGGSSEGGGGGSSSFPCDDPSPVTVDGTDTGYVSCGGEFTHRASIVECPSIVPRADFTCPDDGTGTSTCSTDADCTDQPNGYCVGSSFGAPGCSCAYGCRSDSDCSDGSVCMCGNPVGRCVAAQCTSDADCSGDLLCTTYVTEPGCGGTAFACQSAKDECAADSDCQSNEQCTYASGRHVCAPITCAIGRPFLVRGDERVADPCGRADWCSCLAAPVDGLGAGERAALAAHWLRVAQMEHASVAAFSRFSLELMRYGAPARLINASHCAARDEIRHARNAFALAARYGTTRLGPSALPTADAMSASPSLAEAAVLAFLEGCIGETVAALEAREAAARATDPVVKRVLEGVAHDETAHAELAWRFVMWALERDSGVAAALRAVLEHELSRDDERTGAYDDARLEAHGWLHESTRAQLRRRALREVVAPCSEALLSTNGERRTPELRAAAA